MADFKVCRQVDEIWFCCTTIGNEGFAFTFQQSQSGVSIGAVCLLTRGFIFLLGCNNGTVKAAATDQNWFNLNEYDEREIISNHLVGP